MLMIVLSVFFSSQLYSKQNDRHGVSIYINPDVVFYKDTTGFQIAAGLKTSLRSLFGSIPTIGRDLVLGAGLLFYYTPSDFDLSLTCVGVVFNGELHLNIFKNKEFDLFPVLDVGLTYSYFSRNQADNVKQASVLISPGIRLDYELWDIKIGLHLGYTFFFGSKGVYGFVTGLSFFF